MGREIGIDIVFVKKCPIPNVWTEGLNGRVLPLGSEGKVRRGASRYAGIVIHPVRR